jgi:hypothetical protein
MRLRSRQVNDRQAAAVERAGRPWDVSQREQQMPCA